MPDASLLILVNTILIIAAGAVGFLLLVLAGRFTQNYGKPIQQELRDKILRAIIALVFIGLVGVVVNLLLTVITTTTG